MEGCGQTCHKHFARNSSERSELVEDGAARRCLHLMTLGERSVPVATERELVKHLHRTLTATWHHSTCFDHQTPYENTLWGCLSWKQSCRRATTRKKNKLKGKSVGRSQKSLGSSIHIKMDTCMHSTHVLCNWLSMCFQKHAHSMNTIDQT